MGRHLDGFCKEPQPVARNGYGANQDVKAEPNGKGMKCLFAKLGFPATQFEQDCYPAYVKQPDYANADQQQQERLGETEFTPMEPEIESEEKAIRVMPSIPVHLAQT
jgi:hypothetical protein